MQNRVQRVHLLDELRGLSIILMVIYHAVFDLVYVFSVSFSIFNSPFVNFLRDLFASLFIFISGVSCNFSKNNLKRGLRYLLFGVSISLVTYWIFGEATILFGILHLLGISALVYHLCHRAVDIIDAKIGFWVSVTLFILLFNVQNGYIGISWLFKIPLPEIWYKGSFLFILGLPAKGFFSADYFPIISWIFIFFAGAFFGRFAKKNELPAFFYQSHIPLLSKIGSHTLIIYILHQPLIYLLLSLIFHLIK